MALVRRCTPVFLAFLLAAVSSAPAWALPDSTLSAYTAHLETLRSLLIDCRANPAACDANKVGSDETVHLDGLDAGANVNSFEARYGWLRESLKQAHDPAMKDRADELNSALARIQDALQNAKSAGGTAPVPFKDIAQARTNANAILGQPEFLTVSRQSLRDRILAHVLLWIDTLFGQVAEFGQRSPWIGPALEWGLIVLALTGLMLWAMRVLQRQRLKLQFEAARQTEPWETASLNWRTRAAEQAARQDWREAVHCLYWASIVMLEGQRLWLPNRSRTPREYVRLLEAGSQRWTLLRQQTQGFERIWYGLRPAQSDDYQNALQLHEELRTA